MNTETLSLSVFRTHAEALAEKLNKEAFSFTVVIWCVADAANWSDETKPGSLPVTVQGPCWVVVANR